MSVQSKPTAPLFIKESNGDMKIHPIWDQFFDEMARFMIQNLGDEGLKAPPQSTSNISALATAQSNGAILYDKDTDEFKGCVNGVMKTFTLT